jgi:lysophospholipase L1-like esterase
MQKAARSWDRALQAILLAVLALVIALVGLQVGGRAQERNGNWVVAWTTSMVSLAQTGGAGGGRGGAPEPVTLTNATTRMIVRPTIGGTAVRVRVDNTFGTSPLVIGGGSVGISLARRGLVEGSLVKLTFNGSPTVTVPAGKRVMSDAAQLKVQASQDIAVSLFIPGTKVPITSHNGALTTSFLTKNDAGDHVADTNNTAFTETTTAMYYVSAFDVLTTNAAGAIVAFGDSITDGTCATLDAHNRWEDVLALRLMLQGGKEIAVVNEGIGGNTITSKNLTPPANSPPGLERFDRDALELSGATHVVLFEGTNDIRRDISAEAVIAGMQELIRRGKAAKLKMIGATIIPRHNVAPTEGNSGWNPEKTAQRSIVNEWIRQRANFDAVIDFDKVVWDSKNHDLIDPGYNCGDGIHPSPLGYLAMGRSIDLKLFR